jgi:RecB family exonuclease
MTTQQFASTQAALAELKRLVQESKAGDAFAPVTVIVPSRASALDIPRYLAKKSDSGVVGVRAFTLNDLAIELFALSPEAHGRGLLDPMIRQGALAAALAGTPGVFKEVAAQPGTAAALTRTSKALDSVRVDEAASLPELVRDVLRLNGAALAALNSAYFTEAEAASGAAKLLGEPSVRVQLGAIIAFMLPTGQGPTMEPLLEALSNAGMKSLAAAGSISQAERIASASDSDDECRTIVRSVTELLSSGVPGHRIGVFYSSTDPYRSLLARRLDEAGIEFSGPAAQQLRDSPHARGLLRLLQLDPSALDVRAVLNTMAEGTMNWRDHKLPSPAACERLYLNPPRDDEASENELALDEPSQERKARRLAELVQFSSFCSALSGALTRVAQASTWVAAATELRDFIHEFLGPRSASEHPRVSVARAAVLEVTDSLRQLDGVAPAPNGAALRTALEQGIDRRSGRTGKIGVGVSVGTIADGVGRDLDVVILAGLAEGLAPSRVREDPLFPDHVKIELGTGLPTAEQRVVLAHEQFLATLASGSRTFVFFPRGNLRGGGSYEMSRWISADLQDPQAVLELKSYEHGIRTGAGTTSGLAPTAQEWRLRACLGGSRNELATDDGVLHRALEIRHDRHHGVFSRFNGDLSRYAGSFFDPAKAISPTSLEDWASNPFSYFMKRVLKVQVFEDIQLELQISPIQRGELMHKALETFVLGATEGAQSPTEQDLIAIGETMFQKPEDSAWLGHLWDRDRSLMLRDLRRVFAADQRDAEEGWSYQQPEAGFGPAEYGKQYQHPPVNLTLLDGQEIQFLGFVDRIDRHESGAVRVIDYKTGGTSRFRGMSQEDPTAGGKKFQLPVYGLFARRLQADSAVPVHAHYWFVSQDADAIGYAVDDAVLHQLRTDASVIVSALHHGIFPHKPEESSFTNITNLSGTAGATHTWQRLSKTSELASLAILKDDK